VLRQKADFLTVDRLEPVLRDGRSAGWSVTVLHHDGVHVAFDNGNGLGLHDIQPFGAIFPHPTTPVYASDLALPRRPQDSVPTGLLRPSSGGTCTRVPF